MYLRQHLIPPHATLYLKAKDQITLRNETTPIVLVKIKVLS
jgi:hypothetical protein